MKRVDALCRGKALPTALSVHPFLRTPRKGLVSGLFFHNPVFTAFAIGPKPDVLFLFRFLLFIHSEFGQLSSIHRSGQ